MYLMVWQIKILSHSISPSVTNFIFCKKMLELLIKIKDLFDTQGYISDPTISQFEIMHICNQIFTSNTLHHQIQPKLFYALMQSIILIHVIPCSRQYTIYDVYHVCLKIILPKNMLLLSIYSLLVSLLLYPTSNHFYVPGKVAKLRWEDMTAFIFH